MTGAYRKQMEEMDKLREEQAKEELFDCECIL